MVVMGEEAGFSGSCGGSGVGDRVASGVTEHPPRIDVWREGVLLEPVIRAFFVDDDDRLWVSVRTADHSVHTFDAFDDDGRYLGTLETRLRVATVPAPIVFGDTLWGVVRDELDVPYVVRARLVPSRDERGR